MKGFAEARQTAERALALEPDLAEAHIAMAFILGSVSWDRAASERAFRKALELAPGDAEVSRSVALNRLVCGDFEEALRLSQRAIDLDPLNNAGYQMRARTLLYMGRTREAETAFRKVLELNPQSTAARGWICWIELTQGRLDEAARTAQSIDEEDYHDLLAVYVLWSRGRREESKQLLATLIGKYENVFAYQFAQAHAHLGDFDGAFHWLERGREQHDPGLHHAFVDPTLAALRNDPRWPPLMASLGFAA
jgi:tetratricopeptide (TPR) repeat protein